MILLDCPNCGARNVNEFRYGGELSKRPGPEPSAVEWATYLYMRENPLGNLREWWYHRAGCEQWFIAERHTKTHDIIKTFFWTES